MALLRMCFVVVYFCFKHSMMELHITNRKCVLASIVCNNIYIESFSNVSPRIIHRKNMTLLHDDPAKLVASIFLLVS